jgi:hypothetical protein
LPLLLPPWRIIKHKQNRDKHNCTPWGINAGGRLDGLVFIAVDLSSSALWQFQQDMPVEQPSLSVLETKLLTFYYRPDFFTRGNEQIRRSWTKCGFHSTVEVKSMKQLIVAAMVAGMLASSAVWAETAQQTR